MFSGRILLFPFVSRSSLLSMSTIERGVGESHVKEEP